MEKLMVANLKMHFTQEESKQYLKKLAQKTKSKQNKIVVCLPFTNLAVARQILFETHISMGAQNVHEQDEGAFTGEISAKMLKDIGCEFVIVGHSERRKLFFEKNETINKKIKALLKHGIKPILCIGETKKERELGKTNQVLKTQLEKALNGIYENELKSITIAYEPIWAIGTGKNATAKDVEKAISSIKSVIEQSYSLTASKNLSILYGGSVKPENAKAYLDIKTLNGFLVGGASLDVDTFDKIIG